MQLDERFGELLDAVFGTIWDGPILLYWHDQVVEMLVSVLLTLEKSAPHPFNLKRIKTSFEFMLKVEFSETCLLQLVKMLEIGKNTVY